MKKKKRRRGWRRGVRRAASGAGRSRRATNKDGDKRIARAPRESERCEVNEPASPEA
jgi:hypothetical protein